ncbi:MAG: hypothetical protein JEZ00_16065 [Anaerolineaceae bacterium]|nr:hypothetical protein [Anaerolineaceae bacterium]
MQRIILGFCLAGMFILLITACSLPFRQSADTMPTPTAIPTPLAVDQLGVLQVIGTTYQTVDTYDEKFNRNFVLYDLSGFLDQNLNWQMEPEHMVIAHNEMQNEKISYILHLPITPYGDFHDVDQYEKSTKGVQIFTYWLVSNYAKTDFPEKFEQVHGWPATDLSVRFNEEGTHITEGWMLIWSEDNQQLFPTEVGEDGLLFTEDDIAQPIEPGYTSVYLENGKLNWERSTEVRVSILPPYDQREFDLSHKNNVEAYDQAIALMEQRYPNWADEISNEEREKLYNELHSKIEAASVNGDEQAIADVYGELISMLDNGLIEMEGNQIQMDILKKAYPADFGILVDTMADGAVRITDMRFNSSSRETNLAIGDTILEINGLPIDAAITAQELSFFPIGNPSLTRKLQEIFLFRNAEDEKMSIKVRNIKGEEESYTLSSSPDTMQMEYKLAEIMSEYRRSHTPVEFRLINGFGVIQVFDMDYDRELTVQMFENAVYSLQSQGVSNYVIDLRSTRGTKFLHLAGYFTSGAIDIGTLECGTANPQKIRLNAQGRSMSFNSLSVLVGSGCRGACELEALAFKRISNTTLFGDSPTYGAYDIGYQTQINLPNEKSLSFPYCEMQVLHTDNDGTVQSISPDTDLLFSFTETLQGPSLAIDQVIYEQMEKDYKKYNVEDIKVTSQGALYQYDALFYRINNQIEENEYDTFKFHESGDNDFHIVREESDTYGFYEFEICKPTYDELFQVTSDVYMTFSVDYKDVPLGNLISQYYFNDANDTHCMFWIFGIDRFARGYHEVTMNVDVEKPLTMFDSLWEQGQYHFNYKFYLNPSREE